MLVRSIALAFALFSAVSARADFPSTQVQAAALKAVEAEIANPVSKLKVANDKMLEFYASQDKDATTAMVLSENVTRTNVVSDVLVRMGYVTLTAGGDSKGSLTVEVKVELVTDADTGDIQSTKTSLVPKSIQLNRD